MNPKQQLEQLKRDLETKKFRDGEAKGLTQTFGEEISRQLKPLFEAHSKEMTSKVGDALSSAVKGLKVEIPETKIPPFPTFPEIKFPDFPSQQPFPKIPQPIVNVPAPIVNIPETVFPSLMKVLLEGVDRSNPLPVLVVDELGKPYYGAQQGSTYGGGPALPYDQNNPLPVTFAATATQNVNITGATATIGAMNVDSSGAGYSGSNPLPVTLISSASATTATNIVDSTGIAFEGANPFPISGNITTVTTVTGITNSLQSALIDSSGIQYSGSNPVPITGNIGTVTTLTGVTNSIQVVALDRDGNPLTTGPIAQGDSATALRIIQAGDSVSSVVVNSGTITTVTTLTGVTNSIQATIIDSSGIGYSGSNPVPITGNIGTVTTLTGVTNSIQSALIDSGGVQYSGSNPVPITGNIGTVTTLTGVTNSIQATIIDSSGVGYSGTNGLPVLVTGQNDSMLTLKATTTLTTAAADGADIRPKADKYGRPIFRPLQVRDLLATAYASLTTGTEANLLAAVAGQSFDLIWIMMSNQSTAATQVDVRPVTAGNIAMTFQVPANGTVGIAPPVPLPGSNDTGNNWTVDMPDQTGTTVNISALFSREI